MNYNTDESFWGLTSRLLWTITLMSRFELDICIRVIWVYGFNTHYYYSQKLVEWLHRTERTAKIRFWRQSALETSRPLTLYVGEYTQISCVITKNPTNSFWTKKRTKSATILDWKQTKMSNLTDQNCHCYAKISCICTFNKLSNYYWVVY